MFSREGRVRLFLAFLILVLVLTNSQSLQLSYHSQVLLRTVAEIISHSWMDATCSSTSAGKRIF